MQNEEKKEMQERPRLERNARNRRRRLFGIGMIWGAIVIPAIRGLIRSEVVQPLPAPVPPPVPEFAQDSDMPQPNSTYLNLTQSLKNETNEAEVKTDERCADFKRLVKKGSACHKKVVHQQEGSDRRRELALETLEYYKSALQALPECSSAKIRLGSSGNTVEPKQYIYNKFMLLIGDMYEDIKSVEGGQGKPNPKAFAWKNAILPFLADEEFIATALEELGNKFFPNQGLNTPTSLTIADLMEECAIKIHGRFPIYRGGDAVERAAYLKREAIAAPYRRYYDFLYSIRRCPGAALENIDPDYQLLRWDSGSGKYEGVGRRDQARDQARWRMAGKVLACGVFGVTYLASGCLAYRMGVGMQDVMPAP